MVEAGIRLGDPDDGREAILVTDPPDGLVGRVDHHVADPRVLEQHALLAGVDVNLDDVAEGVIVGRVISFAGIGIVGEAGHLVEHHPLDFGELGQRPGGKVHPPEEANRAGIAEGGDQAVGLGIDEPAADRAEALGRQMRHFGQRVGRQLGQLLLLEVMLEADPFGPGVAQLAAEHLFELRRIERLAALVAAEPLDDLVGAIFERQP